MCPLLLIITFLFFIKLNRFVARDPGRMIYIRLHSFQFDTRGYFLERDGQKCVDVEVDIQRCDFCSRRCLFVFGLPGDELPCDMRIPSDKQDKLHGCLEHLFNQVSCGALTKKPKTFFNVSVLQNQRVCSNPQPSLFTNDTWLLVQTLPGD